MNKKITLEELILEMMPFSEELMNWCKNHPEFFVALKNIYPAKFISPAMIMTSTSPNYPNDEVIGVYSYHYQLNKPIFKQDFIINKGRTNQEFILFTRNPMAGSSKYVKDINEFFRTYGKGGHYVDTHHLTLKQLPTEMQERAKQAIRLAKKMRGADMTKLTQEHIDKIYQQVKSVKTNGEWYVKQKIQSTGVKNG